MIDIEWTAQLRFIVALALGFLVGLERESSKSKQKKIVLGGVRTYPIISMLGFGCAWLYSIGVQAILPIGLIAVSGLTAISYFTKVQTERLGVTSEVTALVTFIVGALAYLVDIWAAMTLGIINTILLSEKARLEEMVEKLDRVEFLAVLKFLLVTLIILPVLPDKDYTIFHLNPSKIWKIVIIVSSLGFIGYFLSKRLGDHIGFRLSGFIGGIVSSTAVSIAYGRMAQKNENVANNALQGALIASSVMYLRVLILIMIVNPLIVSSVWWQLIVLSIIGFVLSYFDLKVHSGKSSFNKDSQNLQNPFEIRPSLMFALLFVLLTVITGWVKMYFGQSGVLTLSIIVGVTDIDPFILSIISTSNFEIKVMASAIIISMMSNTIMKGIYFSYLSAESRKESLIRFGILAVLHIPIVVLTMI
ncbi:MgtC/SapB family protein [Rosettibacter firmus]|uniref:MgtC/SapB family protein n=1 Tax=Rosettibacter firmus TaxID=3111522 RepID=UPI00336C0A05